MTQIVQISKIISGKALRSQRKSLWVQFPVNTHNAKRKVAWMHC